MLRFNVNDPSTWTEYENHPSFKRYAFADDWRTWYEGNDAQTDLSLLRSCSIELVRSFPQARLELVVLDDLTTFVQFKIGVVEGQFGIGCAPGSVYVHLDANPIDQHAIETEIDDLPGTQLATLICRFLGGQD